MLPILSRDDYLALRDEAKHKKLVALVRKLYAEGAPENEVSAQKRKLLQFNYSCIPGEDGLLKGCQTASMTYGMDIDHIAPEKMLEVAESILSKKDEIGLLMLERSVRCEGYHLVLKRVAGLSQEDNLKRVADILNVEPDKAVKDIQRVFFGTTNNEDDLLFLSDDLFIIEKAPAVQSLSLPNLVETSEEKGAVGELPYGKIIPEFFKLENEDFPNLVEGTRNDTIFNVTAKYLRYCTDHSFSRIKALLFPQWAFGLSEEEMDAIIRSALSRERSYTPKAVKHILRKYSQSPSLQGVDGDRIEDTDETESSKLPPAMPASLPEFIRLITSKVPDCYKAAVATQVFPALGAHLHQVHFRYIDNVEHEAGLMSVCIAKQSFGKGCINKPVDIINADLIADNERNKELARKWRKESAESEDDNVGLLSEKVYFPLPLVNMTDAAFTDRLRRLEHNGGRTMFMKLDEIELLYQVNTGGDLKPDRLICLAYDRSEYGQERVSNNSISDSAKMRWSWIASTTPPNARLFFSKSNAFMNGALSRLGICTIFQPDDRNFMPRYGIYDEEFKEKVKEYVDRLNLASGFISCPKVDRLTEQLRLWCVDKAEEYEDETEKEIFCDFYKRALVIAFRKAMILYILSGRVWTKTMDDFIEWSLKYDLWCKLYFFSDLMISAYKGAKVTVTNMATERKTTKLELLYENLGQEFTSKDIDRLKESLMIYTPRKVVLSKLKSKGLIEKIGKTEYRKTNAPEKGSLH